MIKEEGSMSVDYFVLSKIQKDNASIEELEDNLENFLSYPGLIDIIDGEECYIEIRAQVDKVHGIKISINPNDHLPPHFHIVSGSFNATFKIEDGELLHGKVNDQVRRKVKYWYARGAKKHLVSVWNKTRDTNSYSNLIK